MTAQEKLLKDIMTELITVSRDPRLDLNDVDDRHYAGSLRVLARRIDALADCPQDTYLYALVARIWHNVLVRFSSCHMLVRFSSCHRHPRLITMFSTLDDMYREIFEEELFEVLDRMFTIELKWIAQYSRNDRRLADLANEVLDRRSGV